jgi:hypothetical protein
VRHEGTARHNLRPPTLVNEFVRASPTFSGAPQKVRDPPATACSLSTSSWSPLSVGGGKVRVVRQWMPRAEAWTGTAQV